MSNPIFSQRHYEFLAALVAAMHTEPVQQIMPRAPSYYDGLRDAREAFIDALCAKFYIDNPNFNEKLFRRACK